MAASSAARPVRDAGSSNPITEVEIYAPTVATSSSVSSMAFSLFAKVVMGSTGWGLGFAALSILPAAWYGPRLYTDFIPKMVSMTRGELTRLKTGIPNVKPELGLDGWQANSIHSNHFDHYQAKALVAFCKKYKLTSSADFDCAGKGGYAKVLKEAGINAVAFDFSQASVALFKDHVQLAKLSELDSEEQYDLVTSFEVLSKTKPGEEENFVIKLINATKPGGRIVMSCAIPYQAGPNSNCHTNGAIIALFQKHGCNYKEQDTLEARRATHPLHVWSKRSVMVFSKGEAQPAQS